MLLQADDAYSWRFRSEFVHFGDERTTWCPSGHFCRPTLADTWEDAGTVFHSVVVFNQQSRNVTNSLHKDDSVMVAGQFVKRDGELIGVDLPRLHALGIESRENLVARAKAQRDADRALALDGSWQPPTSEYTAAAVSGRNTGSGSR